MKGRSPFNRQQWFCRTHADRNVLEHGTIDVHASIRQSEGHRLRNAKPGLGGYRFLSRKLSPSYLILQCIVSHQTVVQRFLIVVLSNYMRNESLQWPWSGIRDVFGRSPPFTDGQASMLTIPVGKSKLPSWIPNKNMICSHFFHATRHPAVHKMLTLRTGCAGKYINNLSPFNRHNGLQDTGRSKYARTWYNRCPRVRIIIRRQSYQECEIRPGSIPIPFSGTLIMIWDSPKTPVVKADLINVRLFLNVFFS
jgi:hypothetical protein